MNFFGLTQLAEVSQLYVLISIGERSQSLLARSIRDNSLTRGNWSVKGHTLLLSYH
jgi:hypothetical protein